jgi:CoA:oxalate CoA-transferase
MYESGDGYIIICAGNEKTWRSLCGALNLSELPDDSRFENNVARTANVEALAGLLNAALKEKTTAEWIDVLEDAGVPCGPVNNTADIVENEQVKARDMVIGIECPDMGIIYAAGSPIKSSSYALNIKDPAPALGENNDMLDDLI